MATAAAGATDGTAAGTTTNTGGTGAGAEGASAGGTGGVAGGTGATGAAAAASGTTAAAATDGGKKPDGTAAAEPASTAAADAAKAPEKYTLTLPDGGRLDAEDLKTFESVARANDWTNEQAQQAIAEHAAAIDAQSTHFLERTKADATYGGEKLAETQRLAFLVLDKVRPKGTPHGEALRTLFDKTGYGNHLEVLSFLADLGKLMDEDGGAAGTGGSGGARSRDAATVLYGGAAKAS